MNAVATETLGRNCVDREVERLVFASSCSLYDGMPPGMHDERAPIEPRGAYATSKRYGEQALLGLVDDGLCPVMLRNGTVYGYSPRMRFDLVVNTFVKDALLKGQLSLHGGGWMWRPLVDVRDVADAMIAVYGGPRGARARRDLQRLALELPDPRARDVGGRLGPAAWPLGHAQGGARPAAHARLRVLEREARRSPRLPALPLGGRGDRRHPRRDRRRGSDDADRPALLQHPLA